MHLDSISESETFVQLKHFAYIIRAKISDYFNFANLMTEGLFVWSDEIYVHLIKT